MPAPYSKRYEVREVWLLSLAGATKKRGFHKRGNSMRIALAFPEQGQHGYGHFARQLRRLSGDPARRPDLTVFPEGFETLSLPEAPSGPAALLEQPAVQKLASRYQQLAEQTGSAMIFGLYLDDGKIAERPVNGANFDSWAIAVRPGEKPIAYHKHTTSRTLAMDDEGWKAASAVPVFEVAGQKVGLSICHDMYLSPIPAAAKAAGAEVWLNLSYQNVRPHIWQSMLSARAEETGMLAICPLHRNGRESNPQPEPYAFAPEGKLRLTAADGGCAVGDLAKDERTGRLYMLDTRDAVVEPWLRPAGSAEPGPKAKGRIGTDGGISGERQYRIVPVSAGQFLKQPGSLWRKLQEGAAADDAAIPVFDVRVRDRAEYNSLKDRLARALPSRMMEFSALAVVREAADKPALALAYRSSNYKDVRVALDLPQDKPAAFDERFLFGPEATLKIAGMGAVKGDDVMPAQRRQQLQALIRRTLPDTSEISSLRSGSLPEPLRMSHRRACARPS